MEVKSPAAWVSLVHDSLHAVREGRVDAPPAHDRLRRVLHGATLPFSVLRGVLRDPEAGARYWHRTLRQVGAMAALSAALLWINLGPKLYAQGPWAIASAIYGTLCLAEWLVLAFVREYQDETTQDAARLTGAPGETGPEDGPRLRFSPPWLWTKLWRRARAGLILLAGGPLFALAYLLPAGGYFYQALHGFWMVHWGAVFALGATPLAWDTKVERPPWLLRLFDTLGEMPLLGWAFRLYAGLWRACFGAVTPVWLAAESAPYESVGLLASRALAGLPGLYLFLRPMFPVAATHALLARNPLPRQSEPSTVPGVESLRRAS
ncbi:MAG TPA: hypothetical protein VK447_01325 [Myxococcaceae bacterium]|nr:hypothetical protein [Myxococcaceae bacterium]